jgi:hypothetical protein
MSTFSILIVVVFLILAVGIIYFRFAGLNSKMNKIWQDNLPVLKQRYQLFPLVVNMAKNQAKYDQENLQALLTIYTQANDPRTNLKTHFELDSQATPLISSLLIHFQNYPELSQSPEFINLERNILNLENILNNNKLAYNAIATEFNQVLGTSPNNYLGLVLRYTPKAMLPITQFR